MKTLSEQQEIQMHTKIHSLIVVALIAVETARIEGQISKGDFSASNYLRTWLKTALKQHRFHRDLADLLIRFIDKGGLHQKLKVDFYSIYNEYRVMRLKPVIFKESEMSRLNTALDSIKLKGVHVQKRLDYSPEDNGPYQHQYDSELFILKQDYELSVKSDKLIHSLNIYIVGEKQPIIDELYDNGFIAEIVRESKMNTVHYSNFRIYPGNNINGAIAIPSVLL
ncbi:MAG: hypothetical protein ACI936_002047 [Paraglaciecola sp.]|jgi:hypothetical protein